MQPLTAQEAALLPNIPWQQLLPLAVQLFQAWQQKDFARVIELAAEIAKLLLSSPQIGTQNFGSIIAILIKLMPIILEIIRNMDADGSSSPSSLDVDSLLGSLQSLQSVESAASNGDVFITIHQGK